MADEPYWTHAREVRLARGDGVFETYAPSDDTVLRLDLMSGGTGNGMKLRVARVPRIGDPATLVEIDFGARTAARFIIDIGEWFDNLIPAIKEAWAARRVGE